MTQPCRLLAVSNTRPPDRGQPHEVRKLSPFVGWGIPSLFLLNLPEMGGAARPETPRQEMGKTLVSVMKQKGVYRARHCPREEHHPSPRPHPQTHLPFLAPG